MAVRNERYLWSRAGMCLIYSMEDEGVVPRMTFEQLSE